MFSRYKDNRDYKINMSTELTIDQISKLKNLLTCFICKKLLYHPITLNCQDTFCQSCLKIHNIKNKSNTCPKCKKHAFVPPVHNFKVWELMNHIFSKELIDRGKEIEISMPKLTEEEIIKEEIIKNHWRDIVNKKQNNQNLRPNQDMVQEIILEHFF